ncbi:MAG: hypothetical protein CME88_03875 [Hirschia sp.]|nr:hypothetical protein [Hirschia sp.]MBF17496.1 hypothetical protein [Hirschia sp.]
MRKAILAAMLLVIPAGAAFADGVNKPAATTPPPPPLQVPQQGAVHHGSNMYAGETYEGMPVATQECGALNGHGTVSCNGSYVVTGHVIRSETMPAYVETVHPVILEHGTWTGATAPVAPVAPHAPRPQEHSCSAGYCDHRHETSGVTLNGDFNGGVGHNVPTYWYGGGRTVIASSGGRRSTSVTSHRSFSAGSRCGG